MGRKLQYTLDYYEEVARDLANQMLRKDAGYSKAELLEKAGFVSADGNILLQHWPKLRKAFGRIGVVMCYTDGRGWHKGANGENGNMVEMAHKQVKRLVLAFRPEVIRIMQNSQDADTAVATLANAGYDPLTFVMNCRHAGEELPGDVEVQLVGATQRMLPEMPAAMQDRIGSLGAGMKRIAGLLTDGA